MGHEQIKQKKPSSPPGRFKPKAAPLNIPQSPLLQHYRNIGNQAVQRMMESGVIQAKLKIGQPNDKYELEAGRLVSSTTIDGFDTGKAEISSNNEEKLAETAKNIIKMLNQYPGSTVRVIGHTDAIASEESNIKLGWKRAESTRNALKLMGVPEGSIEIASKGESELLVGKQKADPRNRRVEVMFEPFVSPFGKLIPELSLMPSIPTLSAPLEEKLKTIYSPYSSSPDTPWLTMETPSPITIAPKNWLEESLKDDPLIRKLPDWAREEVIDKLKDGDELLANKIIDSLPLEGDTAEAMKAAFKSILKFLKGERYEKPKSLLPYKLPPHRFEGFPKKPGEKSLPSIWSRKW